MYCLCTYTVLSIMMCRVASPHTQEHTPLGAPATASQPDAVSASIDRVIARANVPLQAREWQCLCVRHWLAHVYDWQTSGLVHWSHK